MDSEDLDAIVAAVLTGILLKDEDMPVKHQIISRYREMLKALRASGGATRDSDGNHG